MVSALDLAFDPGFDPFGNAITLQHASSAAAVHDFILGFIGYQPRILAVLGVADSDHSLIVQTCAAALHLFSESPGGPAKALQHLHTAAQAGLPNTARERQLAAAVACWARGETRAALSLHEALAQQHPRDLMAVKLGQYHAFNAGDAPALLRLALQAMPAADDVPALHGLLAFGYEQCHLLQAAEASARHGLALDPADPWAQHALAHVLLTTGRLVQGRDFLQQASAGWHGLTSFMRCHNWWHLALFQIELGDNAAALQLYDHQVWGVDKTYSQDQVGAVSLLARLGLAGMDDGTPDIKLQPRWAELASHLTGRVADQVLPFLDLQYLYGLARAGRPEAHTLLANITRFAPQAPADSRVAWCSVAVPAAQGLQAHAEGRWADAAQQMSLALPQLALIGGSHAQRDLFEQIHHDALQRSGQGVALLNLLQPQANGQPQSVRLQRQLQSVYAGLGLALPAPSGATPAVPKALASPCVVRRAEASDRLPLQHMLELYTHDLCDFWPRDLDRHGLYGYALDKYWRQAGCTPFVFTVDSCYAGFALVDDDVCLPDNSLWMAQFFVLRKYRRSGLASHAATHIFNTLRGQWEVGQVPLNLPAQAFWRKLIRHYTNGVFTDQNLDDERWCGPLQCFDNRLGGV